MTLQAYQQSYQRLEQLVRQLQVKAAHNAVTSTELKVDLLEIQQVQQQIVSLQLNFPDQQEAVAQIQPIQTEITKQLRLLETDILFLQTARQSATVQQRKQQICNRLTLLLRYCAAILAMQ